MLLSTPALIVIGLAGGMAHVDDAVHGEVRLAARLQSECSPNLQVARSPLPKSEWPASRSTVTVGAQRL